ncbi:hypothetical protein PINS_up023653 [Pythium insidiosum]|nr:hypothetical protein PINS_up023653 [Pythium insidiosum]
MPSYVPKLRSLLEGGVALREISGCNWIEAPRGTYAIRSPAHKRSLCQLEIDVVYTNVVSHARLSGSGESSRRFRILSFDIECMGRKGQFPEAEKDPVIQIANVLQVQGESSPLHVQADLGAHVLEFEQEGDLLEKWASFVQEVDPDIITAVQHLTTSTCRTS